MKGHQSALEHAIRCGELLTLAKETVTKGWQQWLKDNFIRYRPDNKCDSTGNTLKEFSIPQTTASLYMRIYEYRDYVREVAERKVANNALLHGTDVSVRMAEDWIKTKRYNERSPAQKAADKARTDKAAAVRAKKAVQQGEVKSSVAEYLQDELKTTLQNSAPDEVFSALKVAWTEDQITDLVKRCSEYLKKQTARETASAPAVH
jgi:hypothetical protein